MEEASVFCCKQKGGLCPPSSDLVGVRGLEPPTSASQTPRATDCATPRYPTGGSLEKARQRVKRGRRAIAKKGNR